MKQYKKINYIEAITNDIKSALENCQGTLLIFKASDRTQSSKTSIVIELPTNEKFELFNGKMENYAFLNGVQSFLVDKYNLVNFNIYDMKYFLFEV